MDIGLKSNILVRVSTRRYRKRMVRTIIIMCHTEWSCYKYGVHIILKTWNYNRSVHDINYVQYYSNYIYIYMDFYVHYYGIETKTAIF